MNPSAIAIQHLSHTYPAASRPALDDLNLTVQPREIFGILGPNGGGKTTLFRILTTLLRPSAGSLTIFANNVQTDPALVRSAIGVVFQSPSLDGQLTARENLHCQGALYGLSGAQLARRSADLLQRFGLLDRADDYTDRFSGGMRRRVEIAKAILHHPRLLLLDEPSTGLDPGARADLWRQLQSLRDSLGITIVLTTHFMEEADRCDRLAILTQGKLVALDTPDVLKARIGGDVILLESMPTQPPEVLAADIQARFGPWPTDGTPMVVENKVRMEKPDGAAFIATLAQALPGRLRSITVGKPTLDDVFMHLTGRRLDEISQEPASRMPN